ncbi:MAG: 5-formyltetrahydrofolate cyclo-ligase [Oscillospiraceae bacterium]|nr:5-formyltetrahydrofolate cyclo-ligase [Oscillospiraceae bacterium]
MALAEKKKESRRLALSRRDALGTETRAEASAAISRLLAGLDELRTAKTVLGYVPVGSECDLGALYEALRERGVTLAFPVTGERGAMEAFVPCGALIPGRFAIPEPDPARSRCLAPEELDAVLVPCAAFDAEGNRLGRGGGFYDRFLLRCPRAAAILTAFEAQRLPQIPREAHDLSFSLLVTETGVFRPKK